MKTQKNLIIALSLVIGVVVGLVAGFILTDPCRDIQDAVGTIGRVEHYRDVQIAEEDIALRNQFLDDSEMLENYEMYLGYEYTTNLRQAENARFALLAARQHDEFGTLNRPTLERLEEYTRLLDNARLRILEALGVINDLGNREGVAIRTVLNRAGNAIAQTQLRGNVMFDYLAAVEDFFHTHPQADYPALTRAHDEIYATLLMHNIIRDNKPVLDHLLAKNLMNEDGELAQLDNEGVLNYVILDAARLQMQFLNQEMLERIADQETLDRIWDQETLERIWDQETLERIWDQETLQSIPLFDQQTLNAIPLFDQNVLGMYIKDQETLQDMGITDQQTLNLVIPLADQENLSVYELFDQGVLGEHILLDQETLQSFVIRDQEMLSFLDQETLDRLWDQEVLRGNIFFDQERLNMVVLDQEQLQQMIRSGEQLQLFDSEQLGFLDAERLQFFIMDGAALNYDFRVQ